MNRAHGKLFAAGHVQVYCYEDPKLLKLFATIVRILYDNDILGEDTIKHWHRKGAAPKVLPFDLFVILFPYRFCLAAFDCTAITRAQHSVRDLYAAWSTDVEALYHFMVGCTYP